MKNQIKTHSSRTLLTRHSSAFALGWAACAVAACTSEPVLESPEIGSADRAIEVPETATLAAAAKYSGRHAGSAVQENPLQNEAAYASTLAAQFSVVTPENAMKWGVLQPDNKDTWNFAGADAIVNAARANGQKIKGHTFVWHQQLPSWVTESMTADKLKNAVKNNIKTTLKRYKGKVQGWDVVNEAVADDGSGLRDTIFLRKFGPGYIAEAFNYVNAQDQNAKLFYNDYGIETINAKSDAVYELLQELLANQVPIDGIGMQAHISAQSAPSVEALKANFQRFVDLGLTVHLSELDVRVSDVPGDRNRRLAVQKQVYHRVVSACAEVEGCIGVQTWGFTDKYSWIDSFYGPDDPLQFDESYQKKPAFYAIVDGFVGVPADATEVAPNYVPNSSFESGTDGWTSWGGTLTASAAQAHTGLRSVRLSDRTGNYLGPVIDVKNLVRPGGFDVSAYARVAGSSSEPVKITAQVICAGDDEYVTVAEGTATDSAWVNLAGEIDVPDCALDALNLYVEGPAAGVELYVDDVTVREQDSGLGPELLANTTFENNLDWWFPWGAATVQQSTDAAHSDLGSAHVTGRVNNFDGVATNLLASVEPGVTYQASGWILLDGAATGEGVLTAAYRCDGDTSPTFARIGQAAASDSAWTLITGSIEVPDCTLTEFFFYVEGPVPGVDFYFDDPSFRATLGSNEGPNVIRNSTFDSAAGGTASWFAWGPTVVGVSSEAHSGDQSAIGTGRTGSWNGIAYDIMNNTSEPLVPGGSYALDAWVRINGAATGNVNFTTQHACAEGGDDVYTWIGGAAATDTGWAQITGGLTVPASSCTLTKYFLYAEGAAAGVDILIDDVTLTQQL